jgi:hypothetical protein
MAEEYKRHQCFPLRLSPTMRRQASELAHREGISLNHFVSLAVAEKISRMEQTLHREEARAGETDDRYMHAGVENHA